MAERKFPTKVTRGEAIKVLKERGDWLRGIFPGISVIGVRQDEAGAYINIAFQTQEQLDAVLKGGTMPPLLDGVRVAIESKPLRVEAAVDTARYRPARGGCSIMHANSATGAGTLGAWVRDSVEGVMCLLSCEHVLDVRNNPNAYVIQPAIYDGGSAQNDKVAKNYRGKWSGTVDAAIARVLSDSDLAAYGQPYTWVMPERLLVDLGWYGGSGYVAPNEVVKKRGRTTETTEGYVSDVYFEVTYDGHTVTDCFEIKVNQSSPAFGWLGDSGALVVQKGSNSPRGLFIAIATIGDPPVFVAAYAAKWPNVVRELKLDMVYHQVFGLEKLQ